jgi:hypothetical protein
MTSVTERSEVPAGGRSSRPEDDGELVELDRLTTKPPPAEAAHYASTVVAEVDAAFLDSLRGRPHTSPNPTRNEGALAIEDGGAGEGLEAIDGGVADPSRSDPGDRASVASELEALPLLASDPPPELLSLPTQPVLWPGALSTVIVFLMAAALLAIVVWTLLDQLS